MANTRLFIHIGTHKTGTTAIQNALLANRKRLKRAGVVYVPIPSGHTSLKNAEQPHEAAVDRFRRFFGDALKENRVHRNDGSTVVLSWEGLSGSLNLGYTNVHAVAGNLRNALETFDLDISIIVYLRRQDRFVESVYSQKVHEGSTLSFPEFLDALPEGSFDWFELVAAYGERFGTGQVLPIAYDAKEVQAPDVLIDDFYRHIGIDPSARAAFRNSRAPNVPNRSYAPAALEALRVCNGELDERDRLSLRRLLKKHAPKTGEETTALWSPAERAVFMHRFEQSNRRLAKDHSGLENGLQLSDGPTKPGAGVSAPQYRDIIACLAGVLLSEARHARRPGLASAGNGVINLARRIITLNR